MISQFLIALAIATTPVADADTDSTAPKISLEDRSLLRCAAAFALITRAQDAGVEEALKWPQLDEQGREFFVRALAQVMDQTGLDRSGIARITEAEAMEIHQSGNLDKIMPACLVMLQSSGL